MSKKLLWGAGAAAAAFNRRVHRAPPLPVIATAHVGFILSPFTLGNVLNTSNDAVTYTDQTILNNNLDTLSEMCFASDLNELLAVSTDSTHRVIRSTDGVILTQHDASIVKSWVSVCRAPELGLYLALASDGTIMSSANGQAWTTRRATDGGTWYKIRWSGSLAVAVGDNRVATSSNGTAWTNRTAAVIGTRTLAWAGALSLWVAAGVTALTTVRAMTSPDAITWADASDTVANSLGTAIDMAWSPDVSRLVMTTSGTIQAGVGYHAYSDDAVNWSSNAFPNPEAINGGGAVRWSHTLGKYVALAPHSSNYHMGTSANGLAWTMTALGFSGNTFAMTVTR